jgi:hypothetical protein
MNWKSRGDRIGRIQERDYFGRVFLPIAYLLCATGLLIMAWQGLNKMEEQHVSRDFLVLGQGFFLMPIPFWLVRFLRGHYSKRLRD